MKRLVNNPDNSASPLRILLKEFWSNIGNICCMKILLVFGLLLPASHSIGQDEPAPQFSYRTMTPTTPDMTSLGRYAMQPPNMWNGRPQHTINLFEINESGVSFSMDLFYNYSGFRVKEGAPRMGLGWGLTEGTIVKVVKHVDDEFPGLLKKFSDWSYKDGLENDQEFGPGIILPVIDVSTHLGDFNLSQNRLYYKLYDGQPDLYIYNFCGYNGRFLVIGDEIIKLNHSDLDICYTGVDFTITTPDGVIYSFDLTETSCPTGNDSYAETCGGPLSIGSSTISKVGWKLSRIYNPNTRGYINFNYQLYQKNFISGTENNALTIIGKYNPNLAYHDWMENPNTYNVVGQTGILQSIETENLHIVFTPASEPVNESDKAVNDIKIFSKQDLANPFKKIEFQYGYAVGKISQSDARWRMLKNLTIQDMQYNFSYADESYRSDLMTLDTKSIDHWGYYNGKPNQTLYPDFIRLKLLQLSNNYLGNIVPWANRTPDILFTQKFSLEKIEFPTKGFVRYEYESANGYGIRVKHMEENDGIKSTHKYYKYSNSVTYEPDYNPSEYTAMSYCTEYGYQPIRRYLTFPVYSMRTWDFCEDVIVYNTNVTESLGDVNGIGGKTEFCFKLDVYVSPTPILTGKKYIDASGKIIKEETFNYHNEYLGEIFYWNEPQLQRTGIPSRCEGAAGCHPIDVLDDYPIILGTFVSSSQIIRRYWTYMNSMTTITDGVTSTKHFGYRQLPATKTPPVDCNVVEIETKQSDGVNRVSKFKYPHDINETVYTSMRACNMLQPLIQQTDYTDGVLLQTSRLNYNEYLSGMYHPSSLVKTAGNETWTEMEFLGYDNRGNPIDVSSKSGIRVSYLWGYNGQYPIAKIENATFAEVKAALGTITPESVAAKPEPSVTDFAAINRLREIEPLKSKSMITTYTYKPLVGMTSETDPSGRKVFYEYDDSGRLIYVKDENKDILTDYQYKYKNQ